MGTTSIGLHSPKNSSSSNAPSKLKKIANRAGRSNRSRWKACGREGQKCSEKVFGSKKSAHKKNIGGHRVGDLKVYSPAERYKIRIDSLMSNLSINHPNPKSELLVIEYIFREIKSLPEAPSKENRALLIDAVSKLKQRVIDIKNTPPKLPSQAAKPKRQISPSSLTDTSSQHATSNKKKPAIKPAIPLKPSKEKIAAYEGRPPVPQHAKPKPKSKDPKDIKKTMDGVNKKKGKAQHYALRDKDQPLRGAFGQSPKNMRVDKENALKEHSKALKAEGRKNKKIDKEDSDKKTVINYKQEFLFKNSVDQFYKISSEMIGEKLDIFSMNSWRSDIDHVTSSFQQTLRQLGRKDYWKSDPQFKNKFNDSAKDMFLRLTPGILQQFITGPANQKTYVSFPERMKAMVESGQSPAQALKDLFRTTMKEKLEKELKSIV